MSLPVVSDFENGMSDARNGFAPKGNRSKRSGVTLSSGGSYLAARKQPPQPFAKLPTQEAGNSHHSRAGSVIQEDEGEEERQMLKRHAHQQIVVENTYKMTPDPEKKFSAAAVNRIAKTILTDKLSHVTYDPKVCRDLSLEISDDVRQQVKQLGFDRYKIVCVTHIGQKSRQAIRIGSMCCWDKETDNFTEYSFVNGSLFAVTMVFGIYQE